MADRASGSAVLRMVSNAMGLLNIEVETGWTPDEIKDLAREEGYALNDASGRFQKAPTHKPVPMGIVRSSTEPTIDAGEVPADVSAVDGPAPVSQTTTGAADAPTGAPAVPESAAAATAAPVVLDLGAASEGEADAAPKDLDVVIVPSAEALISAARATGDGVLQAAATAAESALTYLARTLGEYTERPAAMREVERLEAELKLARERAGLGTATPRPAPATQRRGFGPSQAQIRAWARSVGLDVNAKGSVRSDVVAKYNAAHRESAGAA